MEVEGLVLENTGCFVDDENGTGELETVVVEEVCICEGLEGFVEKPERKQDQRNCNGDCIEEACVDQLISPDVDDRYNVFRNLEIQPRVGVEYQAENPPIFSKSQLQLYKTSPFEPISKPIILTDFLIGLPIPLMPIHKEAELEKGPLLCRSAKEKKAYKKHLSKGYCLVPGSVNGSWSEIEERRFLLGLYIFGKDLVLVKKFVEDKPMEDIQSYYYGKFYRSNEYRRWSECRKERNKKCVYGHKLFSGMRQQELLSRLFPLVSQELQSSLSEASKSYNDGKLILPEYVFALKALVGTENFVDAIAIGKGKRDLSSTSMELPRATQTAAPRPELPSAKACSSLTPQEITKVLTGGFRLSKAKSNDLFWEAVWPRLLARGWHSEQPDGDYYSFGTKCSLVFLTPGVTKFSRRHLVKGNHYFDCIADILNKVALDPSLIKLDSEGGEIIENNKEDGWNKETTLENNDVSSQRRHCYLQPRTPTREKGVMKVTVVDTTRTGTDAKVFKIRELRMVGDKILCQRIVPENGDKSGSENSSTDSYTVEYTKKSLPTCSPFQEQVIDTESTMDEIDDPDFEYKIPKRVGEVGDLGKEKRPKRTPKCFLSPVAKKGRKLSSCTQTNEASDQKHVSCSEATDSSEKSQMDYSFSKESSLEESKDFSGENDDCLEELGKKPKTWDSIDLNNSQVVPEFEIGDVLEMGRKDQKDGQASDGLPQVSPEFGNSEVLAFGLKDEKVKEANNFSGPKSTTAVAISSHQQVDNNNNSRRQSTRNRPPTVKALEAIAYGFLNVNTKKKKKEVGPSRTSSRVPRHSSSGGAGGVEDLGKNVSEDTDMTDVENAESVGDSGKFHVFHDGNGAHDMA